MPRTLDDGLRAIGRRLFEAAQAANAYGLAAVHIGAVAPVIVASFSAENAPRDYRILYNPVILGTGPEYGVGPEGSVSLPGIVVEISRADWVAVDYDDDSGTRHTVRLEGWPAHIVQHEIDQMNGIFFLDRLSRLKRDMALKKWRKRAAP